MLSQLNHAELTLSELINHLVKLEDIFLVHRLFQSSYPFLLNTYFVKVKNSKLRLSKDNLNRVKCNLEIRCLEWFGCLDKSICKTVHYFKLFSAFLFVAEQLVALNYCPVLSELIIGISDVAVVLDVNTLLVITKLIEAIHDLFFWHETRDSTFTEFACGARQNLRG